MSYDAVKRPTGISMNTSGSASTISQTFDRAGRVTSDGRSLNGIGGDAGTGTQSFVYDYLSRLTSSTLSSASRNYTYDVDGNRLTRQEGGTTTTFTYDRTDIVINQVIGATTKTYSYDRFGNLGTAWDKNSASTTYAYDEANRLTGITPPTGGAITFTVDPLDRHASRSVGGTVADNYGYVGPTETAWSTGLSATPTTSLVDVDGTRLAIKTGPAINWLVFDLHGSVAGLCSGMSLTDAYRYDGFGQLITSSGLSLNPYQYRGLLNIGADSLTGALLDMGARDYAPQLGQFTQLDSVQGGAANPLSMNRYLYALANPATPIDPDGHKAIYMESPWGGSIGNPISFDIKELLIALAAALGIGTGVYMADRVGHRDNTPPYGDQQTPGEVAPGRGNANEVWQQPQDPFPEGQPWAGLFDETRILDLPGGDRLGGRCSRVWRKHGRSSLPRRRRRAQ